MNRELAIGLIFLGLLAFIAGIGLGIARLIESRRPALAVPPPVEPPKTIAWLAQDLQLEDTELIGAIYRSADDSKSVSGVEPCLERAESWPIRQRH